MSQPGLSPSGGEVVPFHFGATQVRVVLLDGEPWFVAGHVCAVLGIGRPQEVTRYLDDDEKRGCLVDTPSGDQRVSVVSEPGLYALIFRSRKPEARAFKRWVTHDVLPAIRRTGTYRTGAPPSPIDVLDAMVDALRAQETRQVQQGASSPSTTRRYMAWTAGFKDSKAAGTTSRRSPTRRNVASPPASSTCPKSAEPPDASGPA